MIEYLVEWAINETADNPKDAVRRAQRALLRPTSTATVWTTRGEEAGADEVEQDVYGEEMPLTLLHGAIKDLMKVRDAEAEGDASTEDMLDAIAALEQVWKGL